MKLIVGLGNPGRDYEKTRHNAGWIALDILINKYGYDNKKEEFDAEIYFSKVNDEKVLFVKPLTYMNNSGIPTKKIIDYYKIPKNDLIILHDDKDFEIGILQFKFKGSDAGHNGIKSEIKYLGTDEFKRLRIGVGNPKPGWQIIDWVMSKLKPNEIDEISLAFNKIIDFVDDWTNKEGFNKIMSKYNIKSKK